MNSPAPEWKRHGRMEAARSLLRSSPSPVRNGSASETAMWASPSGARSRRPSNLVGSVRANPSFPLSRDPVARTTVERKRRVSVQSRTTQSTQTEVADTGIQLHSNTGVHLGDFGDVGSMTVETVDFLIRVLEDRKQELLVGGEDNDIRVKASYINAEGDGITQEELSDSASRVARIQLDSTNSGSAGVTELVRSHSYEALVQLESILEARHNKLLSDGVLETTDGGS